MRASLIIPTLNEEAGLKSVVEQFRRCAAHANQTLFHYDPVEWTITVVDGMSTDSTVEIAKNLGVCVLLETRPGYGRAYKTGFEHSGDEFIATLDGDGTYPAKQVPWLLQHLIYNDKDFVVGNRFDIPDGGAMPALNKVGNLGLSALARALFPHPLRLATTRKLIDLESGMWVFRRRILRFLQLQENGTAFSQELKLEVLLRGLRYDEVPITYTDRMGYSKTHPVRDGAIDFMWLLNRRFESFGGPFARIARAYKTASSRI